MSMPSDKKSYYILNAAVPLTVDLMVNLYPWNIVQGKTPHFDQLAKDKVWTFNATSVNGGGFSIVNLDKGTALTLDNNNYPVWVAPNTPVTLNQLWTIQYPAVSLGQARQVV